MRHLLLTARMREAGGYVNGAVRPGLPASQAGSKIWGGPARGHDSPAAAESRIGDAGRGNTMHVTHILASATLLGTLMAGIGGGASRAARAGANTPIGQGIAVGGPATMTPLLHPDAVAVDTAGNLYIADGNESSPTKPAVWRVNQATGTITMIAGTGQQGYTTAFTTAAATTTQLYWPSGLALDGAGNLYIADHAVVWRLNLSAGTITPWLPTTLQGAGANFRPAAVALDMAGNFYVADFGSDNCCFDVAIDPYPVVWSADATTKTMAIVAGIKKPGYRGDGGPATKARLGEPLGVAVDARGNLFIADSGRYTDSNGEVHRTDGGKSMVRRVDHTSGIITTVATSTGPALAVALDSAGNLYIASANAVRRRNPITGGMTVVAGTSTTGYGGDGGPATSAQLHDPEGLALDAAGNLYIADSGNHVVRRVDHASGIITTVAGKGHAG